MYLANIFDFEHPVSICKEIIQQDINQLMEIIGFTNENCNWQCPLREPNNSVHIY